MSLGLATRRATLAGLAAGALALAAGDGVGAAFKAEPDDMALGSAKAPVAVVEYASVGCPHCARWHNEVFAAFKAKYVDTGKARFVVRECLTGDPELAATGFLLARCAGPAKYFQVIDAIYRKQADIVGAAGGEIVRTIGKDAGLTDAQMDACLADQKAIAALNARSDRHFQQDKVSSTPTFVIGKQRIEGYATLDQLGAAIAQARRRT